MKCLLLTDGIFPYVVGGMQKHSYYLAKYLAKEGVQITLAHCIYDHSKKLPSNKEVNKALFENEAYSISSTCFYFPKQKIKFPGHYIYSSYQYSCVLYDIFKDQMNEFDLIYIKGFSGWKFTAHKKINIPILLNFHGYEMFQLLPSISMKLQGLILQWAVKKNIKNADYLVSYGGKITSIIQTLFPLKKIIELPAGIDEDKIQKILPNKTAQIKKLLFVGRYEKRKGIDLLHQALEQLYKKYPDAFEFHFLGPIPDFLQVKNKAVFYHGLITNELEITKYYQSSDVLVIPSLSEGMPNVIMEAMANGCAILATDVGASSLLVGEDNGWLLKGDVSTQLEEYLEKIHQSSIQEVESKRIKSLEKITAFTWKLLAKQTVLAFDNSTR